MTLRQNLLAIAPTERLLELAQDAKRMAHSLERAVAITVNKDDGLDPAGCGAERDYHLLQARSLARRVNEGVVNTVENMVDWDAAERHDMDTDGGRHGAGEN